MRILILFNPNSGRGRGQRVAESIAALLTSLGLEPTLFATAKEPPETFKARLTAALQGADLLIVAGGDGTLHHTLPGVVGSGIPIYHLPLGTENLFARQFRMDRTPATLERAIKGWHVQEVDTGVLRAGGGVSPFVIMCSVGPDASVIRRLHARRKGPISHLTYLRPIGEELMRPWLPRMTVEVDGTKVVEAQRGMLVVANSRQYGTHLDPAFEASMSDGLLDMVFFEASGRVSIVTQLLRARMRHKAVKGRRSVCGKHISVHIDDALGTHPVYQVDGEHGHHNLMPNMNLEFNILPGSLKVLTP